MSGKKCVIPLRSSVVFELYPRKLHSVGGYFWALMALQTKTQDIHTWVDLMLLTCLNTSSNHTTVCGLGLLSPVIFDQFQDNFAREISIIQPTG